MEETLTEFDIIYRINETEYGIGMVYPDEDFIGPNPKPLKLWASHHRWEPEKEGYKTFLFEKENKAYVWENIKDKNSALIEFALYWSRYPETVKELKTYNSLDDLLNNLAVGDFAIYIPNDLI